MYMHMCMHMHKSQVQVNTGSCAALINAFESGASESGGCNLMSVWLDMFSLTLGPFEKQPSKTAKIGAGASTAASSVAIPHG